MLSIGGCLLATLAAVSAAGRTQSSCSSPLHPWIAEVLYDAAGDDTNREFVELFNAAATVRSLAGTRLEVGDGSGPDRWMLRWTGTDADSVPPRSRFVIGGSAVVPPPDRIVNLSLQNGPDAVRVRWPDGATEVLGYGAHEFPEYFCGAPAADAASGQSLARIPDDADAGSNALDFRPTSPSPGAANQPARDLALLPGTLSLLPEQPAALSAFRLAARIVNRGAQTIAASSAALSVQESGRPDPLATRVIDSAWAVAETASVAIDLPGLTDGKRRLVARVNLPGDESAGNDADSLAVRIGPGPLEITEIQFHPAAGEGEWIEVRAREAVAFPAAALVLADRRGTAGHLGVEAELARDSLGLLAQDRPALLQRFAGLDSTRVWAVAPWPSLNNSNAADGIADAVTLSESDGTPIERVEYSAASIPDGSSIERHEGLWLPSYDPAGSPLLPPRAPPRVTGGFEIEPRSLDRGGHATLRWSLPWPRARAACDAYDLAGRKRATLMAETLVPGHAERVASGVELDAGLYVIVLRARPESGDDILTVTRALRVGGSR